MKNIPLLVVLLACNSVATAGIINISFEGVVNNRSQFQTDIGIAGDPVSGRLTYLTEDVHLSRVDVNSFYVRVGGKEYIGGHVQSNFITSMGNNSESWILDVNGPVAEGVGPPLSFDMMFSTPLGGFAAPDGVYFNTGLGYLMFGDWSSNRRAFVNFDVNNLTIAQAAAVPEPETAYLFLLGFLFLSPRMRLGKRESKKRRK